MIRIYQELSQASMDLDHTLNLVDPGARRLVLEAPAFLPAGFESPFQFFMGEEDPQGQALYYNQVPKPAFWEIEGKHDQAKILDKGRLRARIFYQPDQDQARLVQTVEWLTELGQPFQRDHYNAKGRLFARTSLTSQGHDFLTTYYHVTGAEVVLHYHETDLYLVQESGKALVSLVGSQAFYRFALEEMGVWQEDWLINHLGMPLYLLLERGPSHKDRLVWQESSQQEIPENLAYILREKTSITRVLVEDSETFSYLEQMAPERVRPFGLAYPIYQGPKKQELLIVTHSDQIAALDEIVGGLSGYRIHIAALTEMSEKLLAYLSYSNVVLHETVRTEKLVELYQSSMIHLDINFHEEVNQANRQAFLAGQLNLALKETQHASPYLKAVYDQPEELIAVCRLLLEDPELFLASRKEQFQLANGISLEQVEQVWKEGE